ncbi:MAG: hypothetical protein ORN24_05565 [Burkholderiales bacterium]|nr:hypothetical protein [Burkholderiales bacterium]
MLINNLEFAKNNESFTKVFQISEFARAFDMLESLEGELKVNVIGNFDDKPILIISIYGKIYTSCQSCLNKLEIIIDNKSKVSIFNNDSELDQALFDENSATHDGVVADSQFNLFDFIEDEIIMLLPFAPKHEQCSNELSIQDANHPFAQLKDLIN